MIGILRKIKNILFSDRRLEFKQIRVGEFLLKANKESKLDEYLKAFPNYSINFARLCAFVLRNDDNSLVIDVGANIGDTVALLRSEKVKNKILCIEGNTQYLSLLHENIKQFKNIEVIETFLGNEIINIKGTISTEQGTAKIIQSDDGLLIPITTLNHIVATKNLRNVRVLKIDTDGFDTLILKGGNNLMISETPILFFEYDNTLNTSNEKCLPHLLSLKKYGYKKVLFYDNYGNFLICLDLDQESQIYQLDRYIAKGSGAFPYFDLAVFHQKDNLLVDSVITTLYI